VVPKEGIRRGPFGGTLKKTMFTKEGYKKVYQQGNVIQKDWSLGDYFVNEAKFYEMKSFQVLPGDFLVSCSGTIGKIVKVPDNVQPGIINQALLRIRINSQVVESSFFYHQFESEQIQKSILKNTHGGAMQNLVGMDIFRRIEFRIPSIPEQRRIASVIQTCEDEIDILSKKYSALVQQKKGLMQKLLTGQIRVKV
jgi:type I restriction enzyme S subunit